MSGVNELKQRAVAAIDALTPVLVEVSRRIHAQPELAFHEHLAADLLCRELEQRGLAPQRGAFGMQTSFRCDIGTEGPVVAILSEYDALPGLGHACGHNLIAAMGLGAALGLAQLDDLPGRVRYLGAPAEEDGGGKAILVARGAFDDVAAAMMVHPAGADLQEMPSLAVTGVRATFTGVAAHAASSPQTGINALDACVSAYQNIAQLRQQLSADEKVHGIITNGGTAPNIVPDRAEAVYLLRAVDADALRTLRARVGACLDAGALGAGADVDLEWWEHPYLELRSSDPLARAYRANAELLGRTFVEIGDVPAGVRGSTDMGNVSHVVPSIHPTIGIGAVDVAPHSLGFADLAASPQAERALVDGAKAMAMTAVDVLTSADLRREAATRHGHQAGNVERQES